LIVRGATGLLTRRIDRAVVAIAVVVSIALLLAALPHHARAQEREISTQADYAERVSEAREVAEEAAGELLDSRSAADVAARLNTLLPARESVRLSTTQVVIVDNSVFRALITDLDTGDTPGEREEALAGIIAHLASLESAVGFTGEPVPADPELLEELLAERELDTSQIEEFVLRMLQQIGEWLDSLFGDMEGSTSATVLDWMVRALVLILAAILAYIAFLVFQRVRRAAAERDLRLADMAGAPVVAAAEGLPEDALAHADELAAEGRYREAVRALYGGAARLLVEAGAVRQTRTLTSGELLAVAGPAVPQVRETLSRLTLSFDVAWYGHRDPGEPGYAQARADHTAIAHALRDLSSGGEAA
jgi:hypothetical protein